MNNQFNYVNHKQNVAEKTNAVLMELISPLVGLDPLTILASAEEKAKQEALQHLYQQEEERLLAQAYGVPLPQQPQYQPQQPKGLFERITDAINNKPQQQLVQQQSQAASFASQFMALNNLATFTGQVPPTGLGLGLRQPIGSVSTPSTPSASQQVETTINQLRLLEKLQKQELQKNLQQQQAQLLEQQQQQQVQQPEPPVDTPDFPQQVSPDLIKAVTEAVIKTLSSSK